MMFLIESIISRTRLTFLPCVRHCTFASVPPTSRPTHNSLDTALFHSECTNFTLKYINLGNTFENSNKYSWIKNNGKLHLLLKTKKPDLCPLTLRSKRCAPSYAAISGRSDRSISHHLRPGPGFRSSGRKHACRTPKMDLDGWILGELRTIDHSQLTSFGFWWNLNVLL